MKIAALLVIISSVALLSGCAGWKTSVSNIGGSYTANGKTYSGQVGGITVDPSTSGTGN